MDQEGREGIAVIREAEKTASGSQSEPLPPSLHPTFSLIMSKLSCCHEYNLAHWV